MPPAGGSQEKSREFWHFLTAALVALVLCLGLFVALRMVGGVFEQARAGGIEALLVQSAAIGVIVMASIQTTRAIIPVRSHFHRWRVKKWLGREDDPKKELKKFKERMKSAVASYPPKPAEVPKKDVPPKSAEPPNQDVPATDAETQATSQGESTKSLTPLEEYVKPETTEEQILDELLRLTTAEGGDRSAVSLAFFDLPLEQLSGQISAGAERAIVDPRRHGPILLRLANAAGEDDVLSLFKAHHELRSTGRPRLSPRVADEANERYMKARARVEERVRRSIDCLQIESGFYWRRRLRALAVALAAILGLTAALVAGEFLASVPTALATGIIGGFFAMLARDVTAIVERLRRTP